VLLLILVYLVAAVGVSIYGFNALFLTWLYLRHRHSGKQKAESGKQKADSGGQKAEGSPLPSAYCFLPTVTVQLPIFNERYVVERLIDAVARLDWPFDRLQVQVLDDSTDATTELGEARAAFHSARGLDIRVIHRTDRTGYKAGALAAGLARATGDFVALFDADFIPPRDFLRQTIPHFLANPHLGLVQARWGHVNDSYSWLTRAQALGIDGHFIVEQTARNRSRLLMNFNGTAGVWRRACIDAVGGWQADTLAEDLDLSYRAQLAGWRTLYLPEVVAPAEVPPQIHAFKNQQFRWAKGSIQCLRKVGGRLVRASISPAARVEGLIHLGSYLAHPLLLLLLLTSVPLIPARSPHLASLAYLSLATLGPPALYITSQVATYRDWPARLLRLPVLMLLGTGVALNNSVAVFEALTGRTTGFQRTPKFRIEAGADRWADKSYRLAFPLLALGELALAAYALLGVAVALAWGNGWIVPYLLLYALGFGYVGGLTVLHSLPPLRWTRWDRLAGESMPGVVLVWLLDRVWRLVGPGK
jgi:cellulose synthase/poly-beta-1,6-N-acetylglucosamine synthase-like glycosyltransferase